MSTPVEYAKVTTRLRELEEQLAAAGRALVRLDTENRLLKSDVYRAQVALRQRRLR